MRVVFDDEALGDIRQIIDWIAQNDRRVAENLVTRILNKIELLEVLGFAGVGPPDLEPGTRELVKYPYIIVYEIREDHGDIVVIAIVHGAHDRENKDE